MQLQFIKYLGDLGVKKDYQPWEVFLTRKINLSSTLGFFNVAAALLVFIAIGYYDSIFECAVVLILSPLVFILNVRFGYIAAGYLFTLIGCFLFYFLSVKMGAESYALLYYMPLTLGVIQMMGRKEIVFHLVAMFGLCLLSVTAVI
ncbi:MAG: signal transduction histidine kinase, partial [Bacteroidetes bacterium]|nr:signal transduction histidine kinase [Bacteroidota bacterium]